MKRARSPLHPPEQRESTVGDPQPVDPYSLGLHDACLSGWYNQQTGEMATGFKIDASDIVVDVGCGDGGPAMFCARRGAHVILADQNGERLAQAMERVRAEGARAVDGHVTDASPLPIADNTATRVICMEVLEHVDDPSALMAELIRIGQPGAKYLITVPGAASENLQKDLAPPEYFQKPNHIRIFAREEFHKLIENSGLVIDSTASYGFFWALWYVFFWQTGAPLGGVDPSLQAWAETWNKVLAGRDGLRIKNSLDRHMPKNEIVVAHKPE